MIEPYTYKAYNQWLCIQYLYTVKNIVANSQHGERHLK